MGASIEPVGVSAVALSHALGSGVDSLWSAIMEGRSGLLRNNLEWTDLNCWIGRCPGIENLVLPDRFKGYDCRNHRLAWLALQDEKMRTALDGAMSHYGVSRVGLVMGTSTSGIGSTESAYAHRLAHGHWPPNYQFAHVHSVDALCQFVRQITDISGPVAGVASACASSAKVFLIAQQWIGAGLVDAVLVGGVDSLCLSTLHGFDALQLLSAERCRPFDSRRDGISIGEAGGFALLSRDPAQVQLVGGGESSDAFHITSPHPEGKGAVNAMQAALNKSRLCTTDIGYVNAHGTATPSNDRAEALALQRVFTDHAISVSSTKGFTGHTLGAAGIVEAIVTIEALRRQIMPPFFEFDTPDEGHDLSWVKAAKPASFSYAMSNNFGFGGTNCSLIFGQGH